MTKIRLAIAALLAGFATLVAAPAFAYPDPVLTGLGGTAADGVVALGQPVTLTGGFDGVDCEPWVATFNGQTQTGSGSTFSVNFPGPSTAGAYTLTITCTYDDGTTAGAAATTKGATVSGLAPVSDGTATAAAKLGSVPQTLPLSLSIQVGTGTDDNSDGSDSSDGSGTSDDNGALPDTGGSNLWLVVGGAALVLAGGATVVARRRQA